MSGAVDVLVVGAGPAGVATALRLARRGVRVRLLDAAGFPRSKPCGDCLSPGATPLLEELGVASRLQEKDAGELAGWATRTPDGRWFTGSFGSERPAGGARRPADGARNPGATRAGHRDGDGSAPDSRRPPVRGLAIPRAELDAVLAGAAVAAGAELREGVRAYGLLRDDGQVRGVRARDDGGREVELAGRVVVGADGLRSTVARRLAGVRRGGRRRLALVGRFVGVAPPDADGQPPWLGAAGRTGAGPSPGRGPGPSPGPDPGPNRKLTGDGAPFGEIRLGRDGVLGLAPLGRGRWNATLVVPRTRAVEISAGRHRFFRKKLGAYGVSDRFVDAEATGELEITGPFDVTPRRTTAPGALLAGDAAGYFDPLTGQGIHRALATGRAAAAAAFRMLEASSSAARAAARAAYQADLARILGPGRRVQRLVDAVVRRPGLLDPASRLLARRPGLASLLVDVTGDRLPASALADPRRLWRAMRTAGR